jgi:hypothetical protein
MRSISPARALARAENLIWEHTEVVCGRRMYLPGEARDAAATARMLASVLAADVGTARYLTAMATLMDSYADAPA